MAADEAGSPVAGATVSWSVTGGAGQMAPSSMVTDASGQATTTWTLGPGEGIQVARASVESGGYATFQGRAVARARPIAFVTQEGKLSLMNPDGTDLIQLTTLAARSPSWSPDGNRLAFIAGEGSTCSAEFGDVFVIDLEAMSETRITHHDVCALVRSARWSPDGTEIAYVRDNKIVVVNPTGGGERAVTVTDGVDPAVQFAILGLLWSPDGAGFVFSKRFVVNGPYTVMAINADGSGERQLLSGTNAHPVTFSPDGSKLAIVEQVPQFSYNLSISLINPDGSDRMEVAGSVGIGALAWSPDGTKWLATTYSRCGSVEPPRLVLFDYAAGAVTSGTSVGGCGAAGAVWRR